MRRQRLEEQVELRRVGVSQTVVGSPEFLHCFSHIAVPVACLCFLPAFGRGPSTATPPPSAFGRRSPRSPRRRAVGCPPRHNAADCTRPPPDDAAPRRRVTAEARPPTAPAVVA